MSENAHNTQNKQQNFSIMHSDQCGVKSIFAPRTYKTISTKDREIKNKEIKPRPTLQLADLFCGQGATQVDENDINSRSPFDNLAPKKTPLKSMLKSKSP